MFNIKFQFILSLVFNVDSGLLFNEIDIIPEFDPNKSIKVAFLLAHSPLFSLQHPSQACTALASDHFCGLEVKRPPLENINATNRGQLTIVRALFNKHEVNKMSLKIQLLLSTHNATQHISQHLKHQDCKKNLAVGSLPHQLISEQNVHITRKLRNSDLTF